MSEAVSVSQRLQEGVAKLTDHRVVRLGATTVAATAALFAAGCGSQSQVSSGLAGTPKTVKAQWNSLTASTESLIARRKAGADVGSVAVTNNRTIFPGDQEDNSSEVQSDAYDASSHTLEEYVIDIYTPEGKQAVTNKGLAPNTIFQIDLYRSTSVGAPPTNPNAFDNALLDSPENGTGYNFSIDATSSGYLEVITSYDKGSGLLYSTDPKASPQQSLSNNTAFVGKLLEEADRVEYAAVHQLPLPAGQPPIFQAP